MHLFPFGFGYETWNCSMFHLFVVLKFEIVVYLRFLGRDLVEISQLGISS